MFESRPTVNISSSVSTAFSCVILPVGYMATLRHVARSFKSSVTWWELRMSDLSLLYLRQNWKKKHPSFSKLPL